MKHRSLITILMVMSIILLTTSVQSHGQITGSAGADIMHDKGQMYGEVRYFGKQWDHWSVYGATHNTIGGELYWSYNKWQFGWGMEYGDKDPDIVATNWAYQLRVEYKLSNKWSVGLKHRSNCKTVCDNDLLRWARIGDDATENHGFNFLTLRHWW